MTRPDITAITKGAELKRWYWLKSELIAEARRLRLTTSGGKFDILDRIATFHNTGKIPIEKRRRVTSDFDWNAAPLTRATLITDNYKSSENVRTFFAHETGGPFKFTIAFMAWIKENIGKTLGDALEEHQRQLIVAQDPAYRTAIKMHNQLNQYTRDFLDDNPDLGMSDVRRVWALKRSLPSHNGRHEYAPTDLDLKPSH